ncbi:MAG TPA: hypothetical protein VL284_13765 [Thermoanaerobaculia bacterium]|nr:hypothetical protein [Thermoanaerobaculia bacterium]
MSELYRKWGRSVRRENGRLIHVDEAGDASDDAGVFRTRPTDEQIELAWPDSDAIDRAAREIEGMVKPPLLLERLFVSEASVTHECNGIRWSETLRRVHVAIARPPVRALVDLADFEFDLVQRIADALLRAGGEREAPKRLRVAESVGAALLPLLAIERRQIAAPHDGKGRRIDERLVTSMQPPNWFRPSYRLRPRRAWFHVRAEELGEVDEGLPEAIALLAPVGEAVQLLCVEGDRVFPAAVIPARRPPLAARPSRRWYPYAAGTFGTELMI